MPNFFSASEKLIQERGEFNEQELKQVMELRKRIINREADIDDVFAHYPAWLAKIKQRFSLVESGVYTLEIRISHSAGFPSRLLLVSFRMGNRIPDNGIQFLEWKLL